MMPIKLKTVVYLAIIGLLLLIIYRMSRTSMFSIHLQPRDMVTAGTGIEPSALFSMTPDLNCVPGPAARASYYTSGLTPGGLCGDGNWVHDQQRKWSIQSGIGGSLLEN
jgi:hypothetical protein